MIVPPSKFDPSKMRSCDCARDRDRENSVNTGRGWIVANSWRFYQSLESRHAAAMESASQAKQQ
jgi:hypothetical protein